MARHTTGGTDDRMLRVEIPGRDRLTLHHRRGPVELIDGLGPEREEVHRTAQRGTRGGHPDSLPAEPAVGARPGSPNRLGTGGWLGKSCLAR